MQGRPMFLPTLGQSLMRRMNVAVVAGVLAVFLLAIVTLTFEVRQRLRVLAEATSDSVQWVLAQLEVEMVLLELQTREPAVDLPNLRERFDIFFSRIDTLEESRHFAELRALPDFGGPLAEIEAFLGRYVTLVDGPDAVLEAARAAMGRELGRLRPGARGMSLAGVTYFAEQSDAQRDGVAMTLRGLALMVTLLIGALTLLLIALLRLYVLTRRQADENRRTSARLETIVSASADAIVVSDGSGKYLAANPAAEAMFGYPRDELAQVYLVDLIFPADTRAATVETIGALVRAQRAGEAINGRLEIEAMRCDQSRFPAELTIAAASTGGEEIVVGVWRDISERRQAEQDVIAALERAKAGEKAKAEFLAVMSHEMRTPLNGLLGSSEILSGTALDPGQQGLVEVIETSAHVLLHHVNAVLDIARAEAGPPVSPAVGFNIEALVDEVVANQRGLAEQGGNRIGIVAVGDAAGRVRGHPGQLRQILLNLVGNAVKFTRNGTITIEIEPLPAADDGRLVEFRVIDSGVGIDEADLDRVFDDFVTLDSSYDRVTSGTGLGLGISRRLARALGGTIGVESEPGAGSVFWVRLPFATEAAPAGQPLPAPAAPRTDNAALQVLIVDDNAINRFVLRRLLEDLGHGVTEAVNGLDGVVAADAARFDLVLMDIAMPGMDGIEAARHIRSGEGASRAARIVAVTAHAQPEDAQRFAETGMADCLIKPLTRSSLAALLAGSDTAEAAPAPGLVEPRLIADLAAQLGPETAHELIRRFLAEGDATLARLGDGLPQDEARSLCHRLAGSAATFGATALAARLSAAESGISAAMPFPGGMAALSDLWQRTRAEVETLQPGGRRAAE